ncbi:hypothetical protein HQ535_01220 [bacterium]|nr:hypothetical protein [bacterium]
MRRLDEVLGDLVERRRAEGPDHLIDVLRRRLSGEAEVVALSGRTEMDTTRTRSRWRGPLIAAGALAAALLIAVPILWLGGGDEKTSADGAPASTTIAIPTTTVATTTTPPMPFAFEMTWVQAPTQEAFGVNDFMWSIIEAGPGLVGVGGVSDRPGEADWTDGSVWVSENGVDWMRVGDPDVFSGVSTEFGTNLNQVVGHVASGPAGIVATGWVDTDTGDFAPPVWFSSDGLTWSRLSADDYQDGGPDGVVFAVDGGFLTVRLGDDLWESSNGWEWSSAGDAGLGIDESVDVRDVVRGGPGFVGLGVVNDDCPGGHCFGQLLAWTSSDGIVWSEVSVESDPGYFMSLSTSGDMLVAAGYDEDGSALWTSGDGVTWTRSGTVVASNREVFLMDALMLDDGRILAAGFEYLGGSPGGAAVIFGSIDNGVTWFDVLYLYRSEEGPYGGANDQRPAGIRDLVEVDGKVIAVGATGNGSSPVWIGSWNDE